MVWNRTKSSQTYAIATILSLQSVNGMDFDDVWALCMVDRYVCASAKHPLQYEMKWKSDYWTIKPLTDWAVVDFYKHREQKDTLLISVNSLVVITLIMHNMQGLWWQGLYNYVPDGTVISPTGTIIACLLSRPPFTNTNWIKSSIDK